MQDHYRRTSYYQQWRLFFETLFKMAKSLEQILAEHKQAISSPAGQMSLSGAVDVPASSPINPLVSLRIQVILKITSGVCSRIIHHPPFFHTFAQALQSAGFASPEGLGSPVAQSEMIQSRMAQIKVCIIPKGRLPSPLTPPFHPLSPGASSEPRQVASRPHGRLPLSKADHGRTNRSFLEISPTEQHLLPPLQLAITSSHRFGDGSAGSGPREGQRER